jgi:RNA polymerase sigma factor (sigma-70 family)
MTARADSPSTESRSTDSSSTDSRSDAELISAVRAGSPDAYAYLYERHHAAAVGLARRFARNTSDAEDLAAEAFANVLAALHGGSGPEEFFRAYLFTCIARLAARGNLKANRENPSDQMERYEGEQPYEDPILSGFETDAVARAFRTLPERWQAVLWYTEVDSLQPAAIAPVLGLSPNAVSALALRAREGLRQAYLQAHVASETVSKECEAYADKLGAYARNGLSQRKAEKIRAHLDGCARCSAALLQLEDVGFAMRVVIFPLVTALPFTAPAAGKAVAGGLAVGGGEEARRGFGKLDRRYAVMGGLALAVAVAGGAAFASLGTQTTALPPAQAAAPGQALGGVGGAGSATSQSAGQSTPKQSAFATPGEQTPSGEQQSAANAAPGPDLPPAGAAGVPVPGAAAPSSSVLGTATSGTATSGTATSGTASSGTASGTAPAAPSSSPPQTATSAPTVNALYSLSASSNGANSVQFKATPANSPAQSTLIVVTVNYKSTVLAPSASSGWNCDAPLVALGDASITCTAAFTGGAQIPPLTLTWTAGAPASISGTGVLRQGGTSVSNAASF